VLLLVLLILLPAGGATCDCLRWLLLVLHLYGMLLLLLVVRVPVHMWL
jgi:hypothetical protein